MFDNDSIKLGDGSAGATSDLGLYFIDRNGNGLKDLSCTISNSVSSECYVDVWNNYDEGDLKGKYTPIGAANVALVKPQGKKAVLFSALYNFADTTTFAKKVDNSMAGQMRDCGECHVGGGAFEYVPVAQGTTLTGGARPELRTDQTTTIVGTGVNTFNYFIDQYDDDNDGTKGEVLPQNYADTGVLEVDCLMCHMEGYSWDDRTEAIRKGNFDASRVAGATLGTADNVVAGSSAGAGYGKKVTYDPLMVVAGGGGTSGNATLSALALSKITPTPPSANCSSCHFDMHKVDWKKRGDTWHPDMSYEYEVHGSLGCMGCHTRTDSLTMDPEKGTSENPEWTGNATNGAVGSAAATAAATLGHDPSKGNAPYGSVWNKNDDTVRTCAGCHTASAGKDYYGTGGAPDPTTRHAQLGLTQTLVQTKGMGKMDGIANGSHLDIIMCEGCHVRKLGHGPLDSHSLYEWGTGGAMVDGTGPDTDGRLTDHENLYVERTMENNLGIAWSGTKLGPRNALVSMFWLDKDDAGVDINADGQIGGMDAVNSMHVRNAMAVAGLEALTADGTMTEADIIAQKAALKSYLTPIVGASDKLKLSLMGVFFKSTHGTTPAVNAWGAGGCKDCHGVDKGFYNGPYDLKPRDLQASWSNDAGTVDWSAVEGGGKNWKYVVPFTAVNNDNYTGRNPDVPICSTYYGPAARPAAPETPEQLVTRLAGLGITVSTPVTGNDCGPLPVANGGATGKWTLYAIGKIKADQQFTDFHPTTWAKGQVGRSIAITAVQGATNTIRTMDRSEGLWEANFVTGTYNGTIKGTNGVNYTTRAAWVNYLNGLDNYRPAIHADHVSYACSTCHSDGAGGTNADFSLVPDPALPAIETFTFTRNAAGLATCTSQCHLAAFTPAPADVAIARMSAQHSAPGQKDALGVALPVENFTVNLDGSNSACYHVDATTGVTTQGTVKYVWTFEVGEVPATTPTNCNATVGGNVGSATCRAHWGAAGSSDVRLDVTCYAGTGATNGTTVEVSRWDVGAGVNATPGLTAVVVGKTVTVRAPTLDAEVGNVTILWADGQKSVVTATSSPDNIATLKTGAGLTHTYNKSGTYKAYVVTTNDGTPNNNQFTYPLDSNASDGIVDRVVILP